jgi:quercetin dioxygenase-like cupin family protein
MPPISPDIHLKGWGHEVWIVNNDQYCGKILHFDSGKRCSFHYHKLKTETFYLQSGKMMVLYSDGDSLEEAESLVLQAGEAFHVPLGLRHQMIALQDSELFEFSTQHFEEDSYRIVKGD